MTLEEYSAALLICDYNVSQADKAIKFFDQFKGPNGLTPDHIKFSDNFRNAKAIYQIAFNNLRNLNKAAGPKLLRQWHKSREPKTTNTLKSQGYEMSLYQSL